MKMLKIFLLEIMGIGLAASIIYMLQPTDLHTIEGNVSYIVSCKNHLKCPYNAIVGVRMPNEVHIANPNPANPRTAEFAYPSENNWSAKNRARLPFPLKANHFSLYIGDTLRIPECKARVYVLQNRWTQNFTHDTAVADISCPIKGEKLNTDIFLPIFGGERKSDIIRFGN